MAIFHEQSTPTRSTMVCSSFLNAIQTLLLDPDGCVPMVGPLSRWPNGIVEPGGDAEDRIELPRPLRVQ